MPTRLPLCVLVAALSLGANAVLAQSPAAAPPSAAQLTGAPLTDAKGALIGQIEKVIVDGDGRPLQVSVRVARVLHTLPVDALTRGPNGYVTPLTRAEIQALPASN